MLPHNSLGTVTLRQFVMSAGIGWVQAACLYFVREHGADDAPPTTLDIAAYNCRVKPNQGGHIVVSDAGMSR